jgi:hypothetical protein
MNTKKEYSINDTVWIAGIDTGNANPLVPGRVIKIFNLDFENYDPERQYYVIEIPSSIEPLLEVRTWETISQDRHGPVGGVRNATNYPIQDRKFLSKLGMYFDDGETDYEPSEQEILAAIEKSKSVSEHQPLIYKQGVKPKRRYHNNRKKKQ